MRTFFAVALLALLVDRQARAQGVPSVLGYQGRLLNADGSPASGTLTMVFTLYDQPAGGTSLWSESQQVPLSEGFYALELGAVTPIPASAFTGALRYLEVSIGGSALSPRQVLGSVPYAYQAQSLLGGPVNASNLQVAGQTVVDSSGQVEASAGSAFAPRVHTHAATDIVTGTLTALRGGTGLAGPTAAGQFLRASGVGVWAPALLEARDVPSLSTLYLPLAGGTLTGPLLLEAGALPGLAMAGDPTTGLGGPAAGTLALTAGGHTLANFSAAQSAISSPTTITLNSQGTLKLAAATDAQLSSSRGNLALSAPAGALSLSSQNTLSASVAAGNFQVSAAAGQVLLSGGSGTAINDQVTLTLGAGASLGLSAPLLQLKGSETSLAGLVSLPATATQPVAGNPVLISANGLLGIQASSRRFKQDIDDIGSAADVVLSLRPVSFRYQRAYDPEQSQQYGLIAEEVDQVAPQLVARDETGAIQTVKYGLVNALLLAQVQAQHRRLEAQERQLRAQAQQLSALAARLSALEAGSARR